MTCDDINRMSITQPNTKFSNAIVLILISSIQMLILLKSTDEKI